jgi:hypothetical protein
LFFVYVFLYYIPFLVTIFIPYRLPEIIISIMSLCVLCFFFCIELIQMKQAGWGYFTDNIWNYIELTQFGLFIVYFVLRSINDFSEESEINK